MKRVEELLAEYKYLQERRERSYQAGLRGDFGYCMNRISQVMRELHNLGVSPKQIERLTGC